ncbi:ribbon-helix-helix protein, CopG family [Archaeoglobus veneficus]|uniref:CopG-like domain-containing protein DNA-binding protein n=1 Tax=Archaeoglobus veneficus (strain DSM 11195 / SNP6) TaxID=693661 RepID=F2KR72_ARCVS|nr:ribbon-helix-helix protein, CopG family [Archaeoglobus veneficus]AEA46709.1 CopG-like domain-containing protein DNA-binding protein [Archaeoglobus veneficus SNP6]
MKNPVRVTIAFDDESHEIFNRLREKSRQSQSEIIRKALKFYYTHQDLEYYDSEKIKIYVEMLAEGEHVILDIDHWIAFLRLVETHPEKDKFWELHREVAKSHAEQFRGKSVDYILERLEACNFFRINRTAENEFTLILGNEITKNFIKVFLEEVFAGVGINAEIKEDLTKLRVKVL